LFVVDVDFSLKWWFEGIYE